MKILVKKIVLVIFCCLLAGSLTNTYAKIGGDEKEVKQIPEAKKTTLKKQKLKINKKGPSKDRNNKSSANGSPQRFKKLNNHYTRPSANGFVMEDEEQWD